MSTPVKPRGRPSADGTRAPTTEDEAIANECLRLRLKTIPHEGDRKGLSPQQVLAVINREPRNALERKARALLDPHPSSGSLRGANRGGMARLAAELAFHLIREGLDESTAIEEARAQFKLIQTHDFPAGTDIDALNLKRELLRLTSKPTLQKQQGTVFKDGKAQRQRVLPRVPSEITDL